MVSFSFLYLHGDWANRLMRKNLSDQRHVKLCTGIWAALRALKGPWLRMTTG